MDLEELFGKRKREVEAFLVMPKSPIVRAAQEAPTAAGVYAIWKKNQERPLYVGEAGDLKDRLLEHLSGRRGGSQFRAYLGPNTKVKRKVFRKNQVEGLSRWITTNCETQVLPFPGDRKRFEKLVIGVLDPVLQSDE